jgi:hypothetical protein
VETYKGFELEFSNDKKLVVVRNPERVVIDRFRHQSYRLRR